MSWLKAKIETAGDDMREGLSCVLSVNCLNPSFPRKPRKTGVIEVRPVVEEVVSKSYLSFYWKILLMQNHLQ